MDVHESFTLSETEARRMRRGAFLPVFLIIPMAAMFGFDSSKSQPMHFLMIFSIGIFFSAVIVSISWYGAKRRIDEFARTSLTVSDGRLVWHSSLGRSELSLDDVTAIDVREARGSVRSILLTRAGNNRTTLEGYGKMNALLEQLRRHTKCEVTRTNSWLNI